jgi:hypothetical protein
MEHRCVVRAVNSGGGEREGAEFSIPPMSSSPDGPERSRARSGACRARTLDGEDHGEILGWGEWKTREGRRPPYRARSARHPAAPYEGATGVDQTDIAATDSLSRAMT